MINDMRTLTDNDDYECELNNEKIRERWGAEGVISTALISFCPTPLPRRRRKTHTIIIDQISVHSLSDQKTTQKRPAKTE
jgi:hypothetical protein